MVARIVPCSDPRPSPTAWSQVADHCGDAVRTDVAVAASVGVCL